MLHRALMVVGLGMTWAGAGLGWVSGIIAQAPPQPQPPPPIMTGWQNVALTAIGASVTLAGIYQRIQDNKLERLKARLKAKDEADAERRANAREQDAIQATLLRNKLDAAEAKIRKLTEGQRVNGRAIEQIGSAVDFPVVIAIPPDGTGDHPVVP